MSTRRDYVGIPAAIQKAREAINKDLTLTVDENNLAINRVALEIAGHFVHSNPGFDLDRFLKASGVRKA